ncbi:WXG100 family type VII secretion target [Nocardia sp. NPDC050712]|uniref:WXG100 family type VII secretion target n=1 Tax=Nocardia sp. NPDC050712 TaxID=3155518 RepID=UPI0033DEC2D5
MPSQESFEVVPEHVSDAGRYVQAVAQELVSGLRSADSEVAGLMSTWTGGAATAYLAGWEETRLGAIQTLEALSEMAELLGVVSETLTAADQSNAGQFGSLSLPPVS